ncbi:MAG: oxidoreductase domain protein [Verrucomicrobiales bacterium]|nr:oxidoreductase domain protein [Verrucomicrobiales bacterium]
MASKKKNVRYAVVGLGHIAQDAVLPSFAQLKNSRLTAFVSDDPEKHKALGRKYKVENYYNYNQYQELLESGEIDAVYIALPNHLHKEYTIKAATAGIHVLCEKPLAVTSADCQAMSRACSKNGVKLMTAYRLHFQKGNLEAMRALKNKEIGVPMLFSSTFSMQVRPGNIRTRKAFGGGTLFDIGIYCINAARYLFEAEPLEVFAMIEFPSDPRFKEVEGHSVVTLRFPDNRIASFVASFGASSKAVYTVLGSKGVLEMENGYEYSEAMTLKVKIGEKSRTKVFSKSDQFGAEIEYFSDCVLKNKNPEPSGVEGYIDVKIIEALYRSAKTGKSIKLTGLPSKAARPRTNPGIEKPPFRKPSLINVLSPTMD